MAMDDGIITLVARYLGIPDSSIGLDEPSMVGRTIVLNDAGYGFDTFGSDKYLNINDVGAVLDDNLFRYLELVDIIDAGVGTTAVNTIIELDMTKAVVLNDPSTVVEIISVIIGTPSVPTKLKRRRLIYRIKHS
jgi:hypothetical protein